MKKKSAFITYLTLIYGIAFQPTSYALTVGVTAGPHVAILEEVKKECDKVGLPIKIVEFNEFILPNASLNSGDLDMNSYQHQQFLDEQIRTRGYKLRAVAKTILLPLGIYSKKYKDLKSIRKGSKISIPNDPTNGSRALLLLQKAGIIRLKNQSNPSILDVIENSNGVNILEIEAPQLPRTLNDVDYAVINTDWVILAGIDPNSSLLRESSNSPYTNLLVVREGNEKRPDILKFISIYQSQITKDFILKQFRGAILSGW